MSKASTARLAVAASIGAAVLVASLGACDSDSTNPSASSSSASPTASDSGQYAKQAKSVARQFAKQDKGLNCNWKGSKTFDGDVHLQSCNGENIFIATGDKATLPVYLDSVDKKLKDKNQGYAFVSDDGTLVVFGASRTDISLLSSGIDRDGKLVKIGSAPFSDH
jgi:ABC-type phosphate transport system substrate-binding protein